MLVITYTQVTAQDIATEKGQDNGSNLFDGGDYFTGKILGILVKLLPKC